jgi:uncharacterized protein YkwD
MPAAATVAAAVLATLPQPAGPAQVEREINAQRAAEGLPAVQTDRRLRRLARSQARRVIRRDVLAHTTAAGTPVGDRLERKMGPLRAAGEVLAFMPTGMTTADAVVRAWMNSPPHRAVLMARNLREVGVGARRGLLVSTPGAAFCANFATK